jgi:hypothetical protein
MDNRVHGRELVCAKVVLWQFLLKLRCEIGRCVKAIWHRMRLFKSAS